MKLWLFAVLTLGVVPLASAVGDRLVGMGGVSFYPTEVPTYYAGLASGLALGALIWRRRSGSSE